VTYSEPARTTTRRIRIRRIRVAGLLVVIAAIAAALGYQLLASSSSTATSPTDVLRSEHRGAPGEPDGALVLPSEHRGALGEPDGAPVLPSEHRGALGEADGAVPDGTTVFDDEIPGVANLDPDLLGALRQAATDAADEGVEFFVESGWRSPEYQDQLLREAVSEYGSEEEAARWVATAETSPHVSGDAVDIGPSDAAAWLSGHGAEHGLCQIYGNEPWHYELRPEAIDHGCPPMYADPTHDPRMQQ
jgi:zinc D-Ala-D-Ala carboxypeptidase